MPTEEQKQAEEVFKSLNLPPGKNRIDVVLLEQDIQKVLILSIPDAVKLWVIDAVLNHHCQRGTAYHWE